MTDTVRVLMREPAARLDQRSGPATIDVAPLAPIGTGRDRTLANAAAAARRLAAPRADMNGLAPAPKTRRSPPALTPPSRRARAAQRSRSRPRNPWRCRRGRGRAAARSVTPRALRRMSRQHAARSAIGCGGRKPSAASRPPSVGSNAPPERSRYHQRAREHRAQIARDHASSRVAARRFTRDKLARRDRGSTARDERVRWPRTPQRRRLGHRCSLRLGGDLDERAEPELRAPPMDATLISHGRAPSRRAGAADARLR